MPRPVVNRPKSKLPAPKPSIPVQSHRPSMLDSMKQGFSFGVGSSIAHNMVNTIFNSKNKDDVSNETKLTSDKIYELYNQCLEKNDNFIDCNTILTKN